MSKETGLTAVATVAAAAAVAALGLAGCSGSKGPSVASLSKTKSSTSAGPTTTLPKGNPTQLLDEWAACMRTHGDPGQVDPTVDANGVIHITFPAGAGGKGPVGLKGGGPGGGNDPCQTYLTAASTALRGGQPLQKPDPAKLQKYAKCMRSNGIPDFPDPTGGGLSLQVRPGSDLDPRSPAFKAASELCAKKTGVPGLGGTPPRGSIAASSGTGPAGAPGGNGGGNVFVGGGGG